MKKAIFFAIVFFFQLTSSAEPQQCTGPANASQAVRDAACAFRFGTVFGWQGETQSATLVVNDNIAIARYNHTHPPAFPVTPLDSFVKIKVSFLDNQIDSDREEVYNGANVDPSHLSFEWKVVASESNFGFPWQITTIQSGVSQNFTLSGGLDSRTLFTSTGPANQYIYNTQAFTLPLAQNFTLTDMQHLSLIHADQLTWVYLVKYDGVVIGQAAAYFRRTSSEFDVSSGWYGADFEMIYSLQFPQDTVQSDPDSFRYESYLREKSIDFAKVEGNYGRLSYDAHPDLNFHKLAAHRILEKLSATVQK